MTMFHPEMTVGAIVTDHPALSRVFEELGLDYCCGGKRPLEQACREHDLDVDTVMGKLEDAVGQSSPAVDCAPMSLTELADHIEATHHAYLRRELPRLAAMTRKVASVHGQRYPWTLEVDAVFTGFGAEIESHMIKEEQILFPIIRKLDAGQTDAASHCGSVANPIRVMEQEHDNAGNALAQMRRLTSGFTPPADACNTFLAMLDGLRQLELDMHQHIHKENSILFPRAIKAESPASL